MREANFEKFGEFEGIVDRHLSKSRDPADAGLRMFGVLFMRDKQALVIENILPSMTYFNKASGDDIDFYLPGWRYRDNNYDKKEDLGWEFSDSSFIEARNAFGEHTNWNFSGGTDLLLMCAEYSSTASNSFEGTAFDEKYLVRLDGVICIRIDEIVNNNPNDSIEVVFERIFQFARKYNGIDPIRGLSVQEMRVSAIEALKEGFLKMSPEDARSKINYASQFLVRDVSKRSSNKIAHVINKVFWGPRLHD